MRELQTTDQEKVMMMQIILDKYIDEYGKLTQVDKKYHSRAEKIGYEILLELEANGFITGQGIQGK